jgi:hypothetical protein
MYIYIYMYIYMYRYTYMGVGVIYYTHIYTHMKSRSPIHPHTHPPTHPHTPTHRGCTSHEQGGCGQIDVIVACDRASKARQQQVKYVSSIAVS